MGGGLGVWCREKVHGAFGYGISPLTLEGREFGTVLCLASFSGVMRRYHTHVSVCWYVLLIPVFCGGAFSYFFWDVFALYWARFYFHARVIFLVSRSLGGSSLDFRRRPRQWGGWKPEGTTWFALCAARFGARLLWIGSYYVSWLWRLWSGLISRRYFENFR